jgi:hypothetical protein
MPTPASGDNQSISVALLDAATLMVTASGMVTDANQCIAAFNDFGMTTWRAINVIVMNTTTAPILIGTDAFVHSDGIALYSALITDASCSTHDLIS